VSDFVFYQFPHQFPLRHLHSSFGGLGDYTCVSPAFSASSPAQPYMPPDCAAISPSSLTYPLSAGELSSNGMASGRHSHGSGSHSPLATIPYPITISRLHCFNPIVIPTTQASVKAHRQRSSRSNNNSNKEDDDFRTSQYTGANCLPPITSRISRLHTMHGCFTTLMSHPPCPSQAITPSMLLLLHSSVIKLSTHHLLITSHTYTI
jgi:hypothetical protein